jgi:hypothetical protein
MSQKRNAILQYIIGVKRNEKDEITRDPSTWKMTIKDGGLINIKVVDLPLNEHCMSLGMESILAVLVESLLNKERLAGPWTHLSYKNGNCCNMTRCGFRYWFGNGRSLESYLNLLMPYLNTAGIFDFVLLATKTKTEQRIIVQFTNYHANRLSASFTSNVNDDARIEAATNDKVLSFFMTTGFNCQQFLQGLQNRKNETCRLKRQAKRDELTALEQLEADGGADDVQLARLGVMRSSREKRRLKRRAKRQAKRDELSKLEQLEADGEADDVQLARLRVLRRSRENARLKQRLRNQANSAEFSKLEQLEAGGEELNDVQLARLRVLRRSRENARLKRQAKRDELSKLEQLEAGGEADDVQLARLRVLRSSRENARLKQRLRNQANSAEFSKLEQLVAGGEELNDVQQAKLDKHQKAKERKNEADRLYQQKRYQAKRNEADRLYQQKRYQAKRQKRQEEAIGQEHPMMKLLSNKKCSSKLIQLISDGSLKKVLTSYFVTGQKSKLSDKFIKTVDGCEEVSRFLILNCLEHHIPELSRMKEEISAMQPLSTDDSNRAQQIIHQLFPERNNY